MTSLYTGQLSAIIQAMFLGMQWNVDGHNNVLAIRINSRDLHQFHGSHYV